MEQHCKWVRVRDDRVKWVKNREGLALTLFFKNQRKGKFGDKLALNGEGKIAPYLPYFHPYQYHYGTKLLIIRQLYPIFCYISLGTKMIILKHVKLS